VSASTGVVSTTADLAKYAIALDGTQLVTEKSKGAMFSPARSSHGGVLLYGLGWFSQIYLGERLVWHYGQETAYASLLLKVPDRKITLIVLANSSTISDASRLLDGNVARSLVGLAFLRDVVFANREARELASDQLVDQALVKLFYGREKESRSDIQLALQTYPELVASRDLTLLGLLARLHLSQAEAAATAIFREHPNLPPALFYYGLYLEGAGRKKEAIEQFQRILTHQPPWHHWSVGASKEEITKLQ